MRRVALLVGAVGAVLLVVPFIGPPLPEHGADFVLRELRLPRVLLGALVGAVLSATGAAFQAVFENPLATPSTVGTTAGASLGALLVLVLAPTALPVVALGAFLGAALVSFGIAALASRRQLRVEDLLLAGIAITLGAGAVTTGLQVTADAATTMAAVRWSLGSVATVGFGKATWMVLPAAVGVLGLTSQGRALESMAAGSARAASQGVDLRRVRVVVLGVGSLAVGACVALCGPIAFVGLVVPHLVRLALGGNPRTLVPLSALAGAGFLPLADALARVVIPGRDLPVGVLTAALGAPALLVLLLRRR